MKKENNKKNTSLKQVLDYAIQHFGDKDIAFKWWMTEQFSLDGQSPYKYASSGNAMKLIKMLNRF